MDRLVGDPHRLPHPVRLIGRMIEMLDLWLLGDVDNKKRNPAAEFIMGMIPGITVPLLTAVITGLISYASYRIHPFTGIIVEAVLTCYILAARSLRDESMKVYDALKTGDLKGARYAVSMIVGRDTEALDEAGVIRAAVETVAENTSDGVVAPLIYTFMGGPVLGFVYKAINTMDSMTGYHNERYEYFGKLPAVMDDAANLIPARISGIIMICTAFISGPEFSGRDALRIFIRDRYKHKSPNSAQTEAACAGALLIRLGGDAVYFGKTVKKPYIGDDIRAVEAEDIKRACKLMYGTADICFILLILAGIISWWYRAGWA